jgi:serralysin
VLAIQGRVGTRSPPPNFSGDGHADILWEHSDGNSVIWELNGTSVIGFDDLGNSTPSFHLIGAGDGFGHIWFQETTGEVPALASDGVNLANPGPSWHLQGDSSPYRPANATSFWQNDFDNTIVFQNDSGETFVWVVNGNSVTAGSSLGNPGPAWHAKATTSFFLFPTNDILWQNDSGEVSIGEQNGAHTGLISTTSLGNPGPSWHVISADGFGALYADVLWQNSSGEVAVWRVLGTSSLSVPSSGSLGNPGPSWHAKGLGDFNGDSRSDILFQNDSGEVAIGS